MANIKKIPKLGVGRLFLHNNRSAEDGVQHSNETIDPELTPYNYWFKKGCVEDIHKIIKENNYYYMNRSNSCPIAEVVVTLPQDVKKEDEKAFFKSVYDFYCNDFGEQNVVNAVVHKDEITPHLHLAFVPVRELNRETLSVSFQKLIQEAEKLSKKPITHGVSAKEVINREYLQTMHVRLSDHVAKDLGYRTQILNGTTAGGNKTVQQLKNRFYEQEAEKAKAEAERQQQNLDVLNKNVQFILDKTAETGLDKRYFDATAILMEQARLMAERDVYKKALIAHGITNIQIPKELRDRLRQAPAEKKSSFTYKSGLLVPKSGEMTVVETYITIPRPLPQQYLIDASPALAEYLRRIKPKEIKPIEDFILFPTDDIEQTFHNLLKIKEREKEFKKLNVPKISNDVFNIAEAVLRQCQFDTDYYYLEQNSLEDKEKDIELDIQKDDEE